MNIEIFSCAGGMAEGFRRAGIEFDFVFDWSADACDSYEGNLKRRPVQMDARDLLRLVESGWRPGRDTVDLFVADPPCTPWSRAGKRQGVNDERDMLGTTCELIRLLRPTAYLIGNVPGLQDSTQWHHVQEALEPLRRAGYCVLDYAQLDAADYGVPQHRIRPFWFGHLSSGPCLRWPRRTHCPPAAAAQTDLTGEQLRPWVTCRDALGHLSLEELGRPVRLRWKKGTDHRAAGPDEPAKSLTTNVNSDGAILGHPRHPVSRIDEPSFTVKANGGRASGAASTLAVRPHHSVPAGDEPSRTKTASRFDDARLLQWPWDRPGTTVTTRDTISPPGHHNDSEQRGPNAIVLSEKAAAILQGFPEGWVFSSKTKTGRWSMIGQAMPPPLAEAVARAIATQMAAARRAA